MATTLFGNLADSYSVYVFGNLVSDLVFPQDLARDPHGILKGNGPPKIALVEGAKVFGNCLKLPVPILVIVFGDGDNAVGCTDFPGDKYRMWGFPKGTPIGTLKPSVDAIENVFQPRLDVQSDFRIHNVTFSGTTLSGYVRAYLHLHQSGPFGTTLLDVTVIDIDQRFSLDISTLVQTCLPVFSVGPATIEICFHPNPNRVCGSVEVGVDLPVIGHWGQTFDLACVNF